MYWETNENVVPYNRTTLTIKIEHPTSYEEIGLLLSSAKERVNKSLEAKKNPYQNKDEF